VLTTKLKTNNTDTKFIKELTKTNKMWTKIASFAVLVAYVSAACDNQCSGHGTCMMDDVCSCYDNWGVGLSHDSGDCSDRICPYEIAWVDSPSKVGMHHKYAECAGQGICDRTSGECACFDGYEGKACQRFACPNDCSGHGTCEYIEDLVFASNWPDYARSDFHSLGKTFAYPGWDNMKSRACKCDATYGDLDCSKRMCPYGTDILDHRDDLLTSDKYQVQNLYFVAGTSSTAAGVLSSSASFNLDSKTFALTFTSRLNETFTTVPISFDGNDIPDFARDIQNALMNLPNRVIDGITVAAAGGTGVFQVNITFTGDAVQGPQHLLVVEDYECSSGCTPKLSGLDLMTAFNKYHSNTTEHQLSDFNSYECGRRGVCDYNTGICACFVGYTGDNCNTLTTLV
jgi:hypothetical protein